MCSNKNEELYSKELFPTENGKQKWGFIDTAGKEAIPFIYENADNFSEGFASVKLNGKWGFINKTGKEITPIKYDSVCDFSEGFAKVKLNGKWGFIDKTGKEITPM